MEILSRGASENFLCQMMSKEGKRQLVDFKPSGAKLPYFEIAVEVSGRLLIEMEHLR